MTMTYKLSKFSQIIEKTNSLLVWNSLRGLDGMLLFTDSNMIMSVKCILNQPNILNCNEISELLCKKGIIIDDNINELELANNIRHTRINNYKLTMTIMPTIGCNFRCAYCYQEHSAVYMTESCIESIVEYIRVALKGKRLLVINWFGGEPLLALGIIERLTEKLRLVCAQMKVTYLAGITTNGYLLTPKLFDKLLGLRIIDYQITLDGNKDTHDKLRPCSDGKGSYNVIRENLIKIACQKNKRHYDISVRCNFTLDNISDYDAIYESFKQDFGHNKNFHFYGSCVYDWGGEGIKELSHKLISKESEEFSRKSLESDMQKSYLFKIDNRFNGCHTAGLSNLVCYPNGELFGCTSDFNQSLGNIIKDSYDSISKKNYERLTISPKCLQCKAYGFCLGLMCTHMANQQDAGICRAELLKVDRILNKISVDDMKKINNLEGVYEYENEN